MVAFASFKPKPKQANLARLGRGGLQLPYLKANDHEIL